MRTVIIWGTSDISRLWIFLLMVSLSRVRKVHLTLQTVPVANSKLQAPVLQGQAQCILGNF